MADLWKTGDVVTAAKLNRIVFATETYTYDESAGETIKTLDIAPADIFDENNNPTVALVIAVYRDTNFDGKGGTSDEATLFTRVRHDNTMGYQLANGNGDEFTADDRSSNFIAIGR